MSVLKMFQISKGIYFYCTYKPCEKDLTFNVLGPVGDVVSEWIVKGALITDASFGDYNWDTENAAQEITMTVQPDYCILNF